MASFDRQFINLGYIDRLSGEDTLIHRLDPRTKLLSTLIFIVMVISFPKYEITGLMPLFLYPALLFSLGEIPVRFILKKILFVSPFALFVGIFNPLLDRQIIALTPEVSLSAGWFSLLSVMIKFFLTISAALLLIATTSFPGICLGLQRLGMPKIFTTQLLFLYRYLFVLTEESLRIARARDMRSFGTRGTGIAVFIRLIGMLFIRTVERAERVFRAMLCRGFEGEMVTMKQLRFRVPDAAFFVITTLTLLFFRAYNIPLAIGAFLKELL